MLSDKQILDAIDEGDIIIDPFDIKQLGSNSYDVRLGDRLLTYTEEILDCRRNNPVNEITISERGFLLLPGQLYLGSTIETTGGNKYIPCLEGKSSLARLGLSIHITAGFGDVGFHGTWTLEITCVKPIIIYPGMAIGQVYWHETGPCLNPYDKKEGSKYNGQREPKASMMHLNFEKP